MKFDVIIGNPPYQGDVKGENETYAPPVYHDFLEAAYALADRVCMIHPARFLFNAGSTPKTWNQKMLADTHLKVTYYEMDSGKAFPGTDIKGGVAVTYRDATKAFGAIGVFTPWVELNAIKAKVCNGKRFQSLKETVYSRTVYRLTQRLHEEHPEAISLLSKGHAYDMSTNIFERLPTLFTPSKPKDGKTYIRIYGRLGDERVFRWVRQDYVNTPDNLHKWKVFVPAANGSGALGEVLTTPVIGEPVIGEPVIGSTETFISIGCFGTRAEAEACLKYVKTKFARAMLGILKVTAHVTPKTWAYVPLQDFTAGSDIDWGVSVAEVDAQLYRKYGLSAEEVAFIESKVKEMA